MNLNKRMNQDTRMNQDKRISRDKGLNQDIRMILMSEAGVPAKLGGTATYMAFPRNGWPVRADQRYPCEGS
jgi:hypothetical protein